MLKYYNLFIGIKEGIGEILFKQKSPAKVVSSLFNSHKKWGKKDRAFVAETIYDIVRWKAKIEVAQNQEITELNVAKSIGVWFILKSETQLPNFEEFKDINTQEILNNFKSKQEIPQIHYSLSPWLYEYGKEKLGETQWHKELEALNQPAKIVLRCNSQKISRKKLQIELAKELIETVILENYPHALLLHSKKNVLISEAYKKGFFQIQDASSQLVAPFLEVKPGQLVIDACAGAGGKSLHLSNLMQNKGKIVAMDIYEHKLLELQKRKKLCGDSIIQTYLIKENDSLKKFNQIADCVLIDAPCSSTGIIRRNPAIKWNLTEQNFLDIVQLQKKLLEKYAQFVKPHGSLVYSTCSILSTENQQQIADFLQTNPHFSLVKEQGISPSISGFDGFYMALLRRD